jgi:hypothetical protein
MAHKPAGVRSVFSAADLVPAHQKPPNVSHPITSSSAPVTSLQRQSVGALVSRFGA